MSQSAMEAAGGPRRSADNTPRRPEKRQGFFGWVGELLLIVVVALIISALIRSFLVQMYIIPSESMEHTLDIGDRVVVVKTVSFHRGDIVVFKDPGNWLDTTGQTENPVRQVLEFLGVAPSSSTDHLVKRVIGMPGDHVKCCTAQGQIQVNGATLDESSYLYAANGVQARPSNINFDVVVPAGHIFVLGDNRSDSRDSRYHLCDAVSPGEAAGSAAFVPESDVTGPAVAIAMPFSRMTRFHVPATFDSVPQPTSVPSQAIVTEKPC